MTTLSEKVAALEKELQEAKAKLAGEQEKKPVTVGFEVPEMHKVYYWVSLSAEVREEAWRCHEFDKGNLLMGNVFLTEEAALKKQRQRKTLAELHKMTNGFTPKMGDGWFEIYMNDMGRVVPIYIPLFYAGDIPRYRSLQEAQAAIDAVGVDRIKELMGV